MHYLPIHQCIRQISPKSSKLASCQISRVVVTCIRLCHHCWSSAINAC